MGHCARQQWHQQWHHSDITVLKGTWRRWTGDGRVLLYQFSCQMKYLNKSRDLPISETLRQEVLFCGHYFTTTATLNRTIHWQAWTKNLSGVKVLLLCAWPSRVLRTKTKGLTPTLADWLHDWLADWLVVSCRSAYMNCTLQDIRPVVQLVRTLIQVPTRPITLAIIPLYH